MLGGRTRTYLVGTVVSGHDPVLFTLVAWQLQKGSLLGVPPNQQGLPTFWGSHCPLPFSLKPRFLFILECGGPNKHEKMGREAAASFPNMLALLQNFQVVSE